MELAKMTEYYRKERPQEYVYELQNEYHRLEIAKNSFHKIVIPAEFKFENNILVTSQIGSKSSDNFKKVCSPSWFIKEYCSLLDKLWSETLNTSQDLVPDWVKHPKYETKHNLHPDFQLKSEEELRQILSRRSEIETSKKVVVHGDLCPVNIIFDSDAHAIGLIDLGDLHLGDKMLDLAILSWTIRGNFGKKYERAFLEKYHLSPDNKIIEYYRLIYNLNMPEYKNWQWIKE